MKKHRFTITLSDCGDVETWNCLAYDYQHAEEKFWDMIHECGGPEGIRVLSIKRNK